MKATCNRWNFYIRANRSCLHATCRVTVSLPEPSLHQKTRPLSSRVTLEKLNWIWVAGFVAFICSLLDLGPCAMSVRGWSVTHLNRKSSPTGTGFTVTVRLTLPAEKIIFFILGGISNLSGYQVTFREMENTPHQTQYASHFKKLHYVCSGMLRDYKNLYVLYFQLHIVGNSIELSFPNNVIFWRR